MDRLIVDEWLKFAENDLEVVRILSNHHPMQLEIICYHCQQATEKALKAYLLHNDQIPPKIHNLESLVDLCVELSTDFNEIVEECEYLNPFGVQPRYPFGFELVDSDAMNAAKRSEKVVAFIRNRIVFE